MYLSSGFGQRRVYSKIFLKIYFLKEEKSHYLFSEHFILNTYSDLLSFTSIKRKMKKSP